MLHNRIKESRVRAKLSLEELSKAISIGRTTLIDYENGKSEPKASILLKISEFCKTNELWLLTGKGSMYLEKDNSFSLENSQNNIESSNINNIHLNNVQDCDINHLSSPLHLASGDINDFCQLIKDYATPKMIEEIKQKLLKIKELH